MNAKSGNEACLFFNLYYLNNFGTLKHPVLFKLVLQKSGQTLVVNNSSVQAVRRKGTKTTGQAK